MGARRDPQCPQAPLPPPLAQWFRGDLREYAREILLDRQATQRENFRAERVEAMLDEHAAGRADHSQGIWTLLIFEQWHRENVDRVPAPVEVAA